MKKILIMPNGNWNAHVSRSFVLAEQLKKSGHDITFMGGGKYMRIPKNGGFKVVEIENLSAEYEESMVRQGKTNWWDYNTIKKRIDEDIKIFDKYKPDFIISDSRYSLSTSCRLAKIPLICPLCASWTNYYSARMKAPESVPITRILGKHITAALIPIVKKNILRSEATPFKKVRKELNMRIPENVFDVWSGDLNLISDFPEYGPTEKLPDNYKYIGPIIWEPDVPAPEWLDKIKSDRPTIYFSMGTTGNPKFFQHAVDIFENTEYQCIITTAGLIKLSHIPNNFFVTDFAPGSKLLEKSDIVICQGGNGTINQAISKGVPIIGIPTMLDQDFNMDRVEDMGIGFRLNQRNFKQKKFIKAINTILSDSSYKENAEKYKKIIETYDAPKLNEKYIFSYLDSLK